MPTVHKADHESTRDWRPRTLTALAHRKQWVAWRLIDRNGKAAATDKKVRMVDWALDPARQGGRR